jgi:hypothetical protein
MLTNVVLGQCRDCHLLYLACLGLVRLRSVYICSAIGTCLERQSNVSSTVSPYIILLPVRSMSQPLVETHRTEHLGVSIVLIKTTLPLNDQYSYFVVRLSQKTQNNLMKAAGQVHSLDQPILTWNLISQILSRALFTQLDHLQLKSSMELHGKDYLLFEKRNSSPTAIHEPIIEVIIGTQVNNTTWEGSLKEASKVVECLVRQSMYTSLVIIRGIVFFLTRL